MPKAIVPVEHAMETCGLGSVCCRYLSVGPNGWECLKHTEFRAMIDARCSGGQAVAVGDNCEGFVGGKPGSN